MEKIKLSPSKARILNMPIPVLIEQYALVHLKKSTTLSSTQRQMVENRVKFNLEKGKILQSDLDASIENIRKMII